MKELIAVQIETGTEKRVYGRSATFECWKAWKAFRKLGKDLRALSSCMFDKDESEEVK